MARQGGKRRGSAAVQKLRQGEARWKLMKDDLGRRLTGGRNRSGELFYEVEHDLMTDGEGFVALAPRQFTVTHDAVVSGREKADLILDLLAGGRQIPGGQL